MNKQQKLLDEAELCGSPGGCYLRNPKAKYTAEPPLASAISSTCRPYIVLSKIPITGVKIYLVLAAQSSSPENKFNHCFFFFLLPFFSFPLLFAFFFLFCHECQGRSQPIVL